MLTDGRTDGRTDNKTLNLKLLFRLQTIRGSSVCVNHRETKSNQQLCLLQHVIVTGAFVTDSDHEDSPGSESEEEDKGTESSSDEEVRQCR